MEIPDSSTMFMLDVIGSVIMVLWVVDTYRTYQKSGKKEDFRPVRRRNALIFLVVFAALTVFFLVDHYLETGFFRVVVGILKIAWVVACVAWLIWRVRVLGSNRNVG